MPSLNEPFATLQRLKRNDALLPLYAAVIAEARKSMDDWIPVTAMDEFRELARRYGLTVAEDCIFEPLPAGRRMDALDRSPTTYAHGRPLRDIDQASPFTSSSRGGGSGPRRPSARSRIRWPSPATVCWSGRASTPPVSAPRSATPDAASSRS
jgi:hypothetical protein